MAASTHSAEKSNAAKKIFKTSKKNELKKTGYSLFNGSVK